MREHASILANLYPCLSECGDAANPVASFNKKLASILIA